MAQNQLSSDSLKKVPNVLNIINNSESFARNQMRCYVERNMLNSATAIDDMNQSDLQQFENSMIEIFKLKGWL